MKKLIPITIILTIILLAILVWWSFQSVMPSRPLDGASQLVLVVTRTSYADTGKLWTFDRDGDTWRAGFSEPVVVGRSGLAWGLGLHAERDRGEGDDVKREGDGKAPQGAFELPGAYGYQHPMSVGINFPYEQISPGLVCIDDIKSEYYNLIVEADSAGVTPGGEVTYEVMSRDDDLYSFLVLVGHNLDQVPGAGSCIFLHIWSGQNEPTVGCTAMSEGTMLQLLSWLDPGASPKLVQLTRKNYLRLKEEWGLPEVTP